MRRSITRCSVRPSGSLGRAILLCAFASFGAGCGKDASPAADSSAVKEEARTTQANGAATTTAGAEAAPPTAAPTGADPGAAAPPTAAAADPSKLAEAAAKADTSRAGSAGKTTDPAAPPAAAPPATTEAAAAPPAATEAPAAPPAAAPSAEVMTPTVTSPKVGESNFSVWMQAGKVKAGQQGVVEVVLVPKNGFHCNENYPYKIKLNDPPAGVSFPSAVVRREAMSVSPSRGVMRVPFVASSAGDARIAGKFSFSVCTTDQCLIDSRDLSITVKVE